MTLDLYTKRQTVCPSALSVTELLTKTQLRNDCTITFDIVLHQVAQQVTTAANHFQQTTAGMMVILVGLQMLGQVVDSSGQNGDLNLGRTGVALMQRVVGNDLGPFLLFSS